MKNIFLLALFFSVTSFFAQEQNELPNYTPPSAQAWSFTKYGNVPVDEMSGRINQNIPIYNYSVDDINVPISLNYTSSGVKVNDQTTWTGIDWKLNAGGVITRIVKDEPDEKSTRVFIGKDELDEMDLSGGPVGAGLYPDIDNLNRYILNNYSEKFDKERDEFYFSFLNYSGRFYFSESGHPVIFDNVNNLKIDILNNIGESGFDNLNFDNLNENKEFMITDSNGIKYYFGGVNAIEESQNRINPNSGGYIETTKAVTGFYLTKIVNLNNTEVYFNYSSMNSLQKISENETIKKVLNYFNGWNNIAENSISVTCPDVSADIQGVFKSITLNKLFNTKYLSSISSNRNPLSISFNSIDSGNSKISPKILNEINIKKGTDVFRKIELKYNFFDTPLDCDRFFLEKLVVNDSNSEVNSYSFEYNTPEDLPARFSYDQDILGFFNNKNNASLIPNNTYDQTEIFWQNNNYIRGDRSHDFQYASKGLLTKINHPTGGSTQIDYEPNMIKAPTTEIKNLLVFSDEPNNLNDLYDQFYVGDEAYRNSLGEEVLTNPNFYVPLNAEKGIYENQDIKIRFALNAPNAPVFESSSPGETYDPQRRDYVKLTIFDHTDQTTQIIGDELKGLNICCLKDMNGFPDEYMVNLIKGHSYSFKSELITIDQDFPLDFKIDVKIEFSLNTGYESIPTFGIRVKRVSDYLSENSEPINVRRFYYRKINDEFDSYVYRFSPTYTYLTMHTQPCYTGILGCRLNMWSLGNLSSDNVFSNYPVTQNTMIYKNVTTSLGGDNFEKGGIEKEFYYQLDNGVDYYHDAILPTANTSGTVRFGRPPSNNTLSTSINGRNKQINYVVNDNNVLKYNKVEKEHHYTIIDGTIPNMIGERAYHACDDELNSNYYNLNISTYDINLYKSFFNSSETIDYIDLLPISEIDNNSYRKVVSNTSYEYNNSYYGLPSKTITTSSVDEEIYEKQYIYLDQSATLNNITNSDDYVTLKTQNRVSKPLKTSTYINKDGQIILLGSNQTLYSSTNASNNVFPNKILSAKGNDALEPRVEFLEYSSQGRPTLLKQAGGTLVHYRYNLNGQVMRKVENYLSVNATLPINQTGTVDATLVCDFVNQNFPSSQVTYYFYDSSKNLLNKTIDPRCYETTYHYDDLFRLEYVKDAEGNILSKNEYNYRTQN